MNDKWTPEMRRIDIEFDGTEFASSHYLITCPDFLKIVKQTCLHGQLREVNMKIELKIITSLILLHYSISNF